MATSCSSEGRVIILVRLSIQRPHQAHQHVRPGPYLSSLSHPNRCTNNSHFRHSKRTRASGGRAQVSRSAMIEKRAVHPSPNRPGMLLMHPLVALAPRG